MVQLTQLRFTLLFRKWIRGALIWSKKFGQKGLDNGILNYLKISVDVKVKIILINTGYGHEQLSRNFAHLSDRIEL